METLNPIPQCIDCLTSLATTAVSAADGGVHPHTARKAERVVREILAGVRESGLTSVELTNRILREIRSMTGTSDPYARFKSQEMEQARRTISLLNIEALADLRSRISLSVLGNSLDFFNSPAEVLADIPSRLSTGISFFRDDIHCLEAFLAEYPDRILYLTDNAGEIYFDLPLYDHLCGRSRDTILVVKGGPAINDLTRAELESAGLVQRFHRVADTGTDGAGVDWKYVSREFLELMASADLVVAKGMANFETVFPRETAANILFLFKVKCKPVQDYIGAPVGSFMALWREGKRNSKFKMPKI
jgi:damage-control phosphatase, subfamily I